MQVDFLKDSSRFLISRILVSLGWMASIVILTRLLTPSSYGIFVMLNSAVLIFSIVSTTWISASILRFTIEYQIRKSENVFRNKMLKLALNNIILFSILLSIVLYIIKYQNISPKVIFASISWFILQSFYVVLLSFFRALRKVNLYGIYNLWQILGGLLMGILFVLIFQRNNNGLLYLIIGYVVALLIGLPFLYKAVFKCTAVSDKSYNIDIPNKEVFLFLKYGINVTIINLCSQSLSQLDKLFITKYHGAYESGIYSASYSIAEQSIFAIVSIFSTASTPIIYNLWTRGDPQEITNYFSNILRYYLLLITPLALFIVLMYTQIGHFFLEDIYITSFAIIPLVTIGAIMVGLATIYTDILTASKKPHILMICYIMALASNIIGNFILIPDNAFWGASISTLTSYAILLLSVVFFSRREFRWKIELSLMLKILIIAIVIYLLFIPLIPLLSNLKILTQMFIVGFAEIIFYFLLTFVFKLISGEELKQILFRLKLILK